MAKSIIFYGGRYGKTPLTFYEYSVRDKCGWVLVEALSYRELQNR